MKIFSVVHVEVGAVFANMIAKSYCVCELLALCSKSEESITWHVLTCTNGATAKSISTV